MWRRLLNSPLARGERWAAVLAGTLFIACALGCMNLHFGRTEVVGSDNSTGLQSGKARLGSGDDLVVHYPVPYAYPPNLELDNDGAECKLIEQKPDYFRVKNLTSSAREVSWKARGVKTPQPPGASPPAAEAVFGTPVATESHAR
jgi:hypothetical protein